MDRRAQRSGRARHTSTLHSNAPAVIGCGIGRDSRPAKRAMRATQTRRTGSAPPGPVFPFQFLPPRSPQSLNNSYWRASGLLRSRGRPEPRPLVTAAAPLSIAQIMCSTGDIVRYNSSIRVRGARRVPYSPSCGVAIRVIEYHFILRPSRDPVIDGLRPSCQPVSAICCISRLRLYTDRPSRPTY